MNKAICGSKESAAPHDELETWKETVLVSTLARYSPNDIYNGDETALFYKLLPHRTYCFDGDKPAGSAKCKDRLTLLIITNMDGSDHRKLSVIGKSKTPRCLQKKYKMQVKDMAVDWYASKNAWMTGEIHHQIMTKLNNEMRLSNRHILYVCDNASSHQVQEYSHIKFLMLPPNATSIMQPLDQGIILSAKRRYKKKLAERYLACVENNKDANSLPRAPTPTKEPRAVTPIKDVSFKTVADATKDVSLVDSLDLDDLELESIDTTIASVAASALMKETPPRFSTPKHPRPPTSEPQPSISMTTASQPPPKKLKLGLSCPIPKTFKLHHVVDKVMNMSSGSSSVCTSLDSDLESLSSQE